MQTKKYQSISHWLSYNGKYLAFALIFLIMILILRFNHRKESYDYHISWVGTTALSEEEVQALNTAVAAAGTDLDQDGKVTLTITQYLIDFDAADASGDSELLEDSYAALTKLMARLQAQDCYLL